jgi:hypothetical protein
MSFGVRVTGATSVASFVGRLGFLHGLDFLPQLESFGVP